MSTEGPVTGLTSTLGQGPHKNLKDNTVRGSDVEAPYGTMTCSVDGHGYANREFVMKGNFTATTAPGVSNDNTQGYVIGSEWWDLTGHHFYKAAGVATGAAVWVTLG
jgi:hypothetical protein